jgi:hypothetical protein
MSAWFSGQDATELVKIRYNFACVVLLICEYRFRSFTGAADGYACDKLRRDAGYVSAEEQFARM